MYYFIYLQSVAWTWLHVSISFLGNHQAGSLIQGNCTIRDIKSLIFNDISLNMNDLISRIVQFPWIRLTTWWWPKKEVETCTHFSNKTTSTLIIFVTHISNSIRNAYTSCVWLILFAIIIVFSTTRMANLKINFNIFYVNFYCKHILQLNH
jgi:hypothetical protein